MMMGMRIKKIREERNMTQQDLADKLYLSKASISAYENATTVIKDSMLREIANALDVTAGYFFGEEYSGKTIPESKWKWIELYDSFKSEEIKMVAIKQASILASL